MSLVRRYLRSVAAAAVLGLCLSAGHSEVLRAQTLPGREVRPNPDLAATLRVIDPMMREDPRRAVGMLESMDERYPGEPQILLRLGEAYTILGETDAAIAAYKRCVAADPADVRAGASLGTLYVQTGARDEGEAVFRELISRTGGALNTYRTIAATLAARGYNDLALRMYDEGRKANNAHYVLTLDIAQLHRAMGDFEASLDDYLYLIESSPRHYALARDRILELFGDPRADGDALLERLVEAVRRDSSAAAADAPPRLDERERPGRTAPDTQKARVPTPARPPGEPYGGSLAELLALVYLERGMVENALETALEAEQRRDAEGKVLYTLAEKTAIECRRQPYENRAKYFDMAVRAIEAYIDGHAGAPQIPRAKLLLVDLLADVASGRVAPPPGLGLESATARAIETLDWMIESFPGSEHAEAAYLKKGDLVFRVQKRPREAIAVFEQGLSAARLRPVAFAERLGRLYLVVGDYDKAGAYLTRLVNDREPELHETGVYYVGLLLAINGAYEAAKDTLTALAEGNPSSRFTNDAIRLSWAVEEGLQGDQKLLGRYVDAMRCKVAEDTTGAIGALGEIAARPIETPLRSRALFELGALYQGSGDFEKAMEAYKGFMRDYPADVRVPDAQRGVGQIYEYGYGDAGLALETYEDILLSYPHYIFLDDVRKDVTRLRDKMGAKDGSS